MPIWRTISNNCVKAANNTCSKCGNVFPRKELHVHHLAPLGRDVDRFHSDHDVQNLVVLCRTCHTHAHLDLRHGNNWGLASVKDKCGRTFIEPCEVRKENEHA